VCAFANRLSSAVQIARTANRSYSPQGSLFLAFSR